MRWVCLVHPVSLDLLERREQLVTPVLLDRLDSLDHEVSLVWAVALVCLDPRVLLVSLARAGTKEQPERKVRLDSLEIRVDPDQPDPRVDVAQEVAPVPPDPLACRERGVCPEDVACQDPQGPQVPRERMVKAEVEVLGENLEVLASLVVPAHPVLLAKLVHPVSPVQMAAVVTPVSLAHQELMADQERWVRPAKPVHRDHRDLRVPPEKGDLLERTVFLDPPDLPVLLVM